ncbi:MAG TPA: VWA domain-containing protein [Blastocatellia bacterium]|nr:VWA domain-containing protein [Blastocatellia bacterium]
MRDYSVRPLVSLLLVVAISLVSFPQSGRKVQREVPAPEPKPAPAPEAKSLSAPLAEPAAENTIRVNTTLIPVPVTVTDQAGRYVPFLKKQDFIVYEDGMRQEVAHFSDDWVPFHIVLMLDTSDSEKHAKQSILHAATQFVESLRPNDRVMVTTFDGNNKTLCEFTSNRAVLREAIAQASKNKFVRLNTSLNTRLHHILTQSLAPVEGRKAVVLFTDGMDREAFTCAPSREEMMRDRASEVRLPQRTFNLVEENDVVIYPIIHNESVPLQRGIRGWPGTGTTFPSEVGLPQRSILLGTESRNDLRKLAEFSAGRYFNADTMREVAQAFKDIAEDLGHQYTLGYYPTKTLVPGQFHHLSVRVNGEAVRVRARQSYRVPKKV